MPNAGELTDEVVDSFLPWSDRVPESCKLDPAAMETSRTFPSVCRNGPGRLDVSCYAVILTLTL